MLVARIQDGRLVLGCHGSESKIDLDLDGPEPKASCEVVPLSADGCEAAALLRQSGEQEGAKVERSSLWTVHGGRALRLFEAETARIVPHIESLSAQLRLIELDGDGRYELIVRLTKSDDTGQHVAPPRALARSEENGAFEPRDELAARAPDLAEEYNLHPSTEPAQRPMPMGHVLAAAGSFGRVLPAAGRPLFASESFSGLRLVVGNDWAWLALVGTRPARWRLFIVRAAPLPLRAIASIDLAPASERDSVASLVTEAGGAGRRIVARVRRFAGRRTRPREVELVARWDGTRLT